MPTYNVRLGCLPFQKWTIPGIFLVYFRPFQNVMTNIVFNWKINGKGVDSSLRFEPEPQTDWMVGEDHRAMVAPLGCSNYYVRHFLNMQTSLNQTNYSRNKSARVKIVGFGFG